MIGQARLKQCTAAELGVVPINGNFSRYLNWNETAILVALVKSVSPRVMIEFGCNEGRTAKIVLKNVSSLERYIGIDVPSNHQPTLDCQVKEIPSEAAIYANDDRFFLLLCPSVDLSADKLEPCDAVFIDGDHSEEAVIFESLLAKELVRKGGIIVWHDYGNPAVEVTDALDHLSDQGWDVSSVKNSWLAFARM
jgi:predicted O-methyltransferase YrrM